MFHEETLAASQSSIVLVQYQKEMFGKWFDMIPGKRTADPAELKGVCIHVSPPF